MTKITVEGTSVITAIDSSRRLGYCCDKEDERETDEGDDDDDAASDFKNKLAVGTGSIGLKKFRGQKNQGQFEPLSTTQEDTDFLQKDKQRGRYSMPVVRPHYPQYWPMLIT